jgi:hypothetical protein
MLFTRLKTRAVTAYKVPNGYCPVHSTGVSCPVGLPGV